MCDQRFSKKFYPTIVPADKFNSSSDATTLRNAMKGLGADEKTIIDLITKRSRRQRQKIRRDYKTFYGSDLMDDLRSHTSGNFRRTILGLMTPLKQYYAEELFYAMDGLGTHEYSLINILCTLTNNKIKKVKCHYQNLYGHSLEEDIIGDTSGHFQRLLISICCANRDESLEVMPSAARCDAQILYNAGVGRFGSGDYKLHEILVTRSRAQLREIFKQYKEFADHEIEVDIAKAFYGDLKHAYLAIVKSTNNETEYFAEQLYKSMKGLGTDDTSLIQILVSRSEIDLAKIKDDFLKKYGESLADWIKDDCSGDYKKCLLAIVG